MKSFPLTLKTEMDRIPFYLSYSRILEGKSVQKECHQLLIIKRYLIIRNYGILIEYIWFNLIQSVIDEIEIFNKNNRWKKWKRSIIQNNDFQFSQHECKLFMMNNNTCSIINFSILVMDCHEKLQWTHNNICFVLSQKGWKNM